MTRLVLATTGMFVLTLLPAGFELLSQREPADFPKLVSQLNEVSLCPENWQVREGSFEFDEYWRERLDLHDHRSVVLTTPHGVRMTVLVMLSETGEQLYHTPSICYEAQGCDVRGDEIAMSLGESKGQVRAVEVVFNELADDTPRTAVFAYWVSPRWMSPPQSSILNQLGWEPFLLKAQILIEGVEPADEEAERLISQYFSYLSEQFQVIGD